MTTIKDYASELLITVAVIVCLFGLVLLYDRAMQRQIELCMQVYEHSRDKCEFVVNSHGLPGGNR